jgi:hypothetical protein
MALTGLDPLTATVAASTGIPRFGAAAGVTSAQQGFAMCMHDCSYLVSFNNS